MVRPGGVIVCAAECRDGFPDHGSYREVLASAPSPQALLRAIAGPAADRAGPVAGAGPGAGAEPRAGGRAHRRAQRRASWPTAHLGHTADVAGTVLDALAAAGPDATRLRPAGGPADDPVRGGADAVRLLRLGPPGAEVPAVLAGDGTPLDASGVVPDIDGAAIAGRSCSSRQQLGEA